MQELCFLNKTSKTGDTDMIHFKNILKNFFTILIIIYAFILIILIPAFFMNYNGEWMNKVSKTLNIRELNHLENN